MSKLTYLNYNNYINRIHKGVSLTSLTDYSSVPQKSYSGLNFNPNDGVDTVHYINDATLINFPYDYCIVTDDNSNTIVSKWFVTEAVWNRKHQWRTVLHRDLTVDFYNAFKDKPFFCRKGLPYDASDILNYNSEGMQFNQILKSRTALKQTSGQTGRYIIGFMDKKWSGGNVLLQTYKRKYESPEELPIYEILDKGYFDEYQYPGVKFTAIFGDPSLIGPSGETRGISTTITVPQTGNVTNSGASDGFNSSDIGIDDSDFVSIFTTAAAAAKSAGKFNELFSYTDEDLRPLYSNAVGLSDFLESINGEPIMVGDQIWTFTIGTETDKWAGNQTLFGGGQKTVAIQGMQVSNSSIWYTGTMTYMMWGDCYVKRTTFTVAKTAPSQKYIDIPTTDDSTNPYRIFVIPESTYAKKFAGWMASQYGATFLYDLQLFPYTPSYDSSTRQDIGNGEYLYWATSDSGFGTCSHAAIASYSSMTDKKVGANQHMCRMIAPNGSSAWEFNPAAIGGVAANSIKYEFTLLPYGSYLHIFPTFGGIYGSVNKSSGDKEGETRGMVCTGPWSLPYSTDNWSTYQLNNSAYMNSFDRQIENMTTMQDIERTREKVNLMLSPLSGSLQGASAGGRMSGGNPYAMAAGAVVGGAVSYAGAEADMMLNEAGRKEMINYTKDQFYNSLQNIKAQSRPLASNSSITIGNSYWPIIEFYTADIGSATTMKDYFIEDIKVHGWTMGIKTTFKTMEDNIQRNGGIVNAPTRYIQGDLINVDVGEDAHIANELIKEINKGVYIYNV